MTETHLTERIGIVQRARACAARALGEALDRCHETSSERAICQRWIQAIGRTTSLAPGGWYQPPPGGASILIGHSEDGFARMNYDSLRLVNAWPKDDISMRDGCLVYAYASPFDTGTGLIGDIGITVYRGEQQSIQAHLRACLELTARIARFAEVGMELRELFHYAQRLIGDAGLTNHASSTGSRQLNVGHTIPWTYEDYSDPARRCLQHGVAQDVRELIRSHRVSINESATLRIQPTMAFTVEPQIASPTDPLCSFHVIVAFSEGRKDVFHSFEALFDDFTMAGQMRSAVAALTY